MADNPAKRLSRDQRLAKQHELFAVVQRERDALQQKTREKTERLRASRLAREAEMERQAQTEPRSKKSRKASPANSQ